jgi:hypothetical protein
MKLNRREVLFGAAAALASASLPAIALTREPFVVEITNGTDIFESMSFRRVLSPQTIADIMRDAKSHYGEDIGLRYFGGDPWAIH